MLTYRYQFISKSNFKNTNTTYPKPPNIPHIHQHQINTAKHQKKQYHHMNIPMLSQMASPMFRIVLAVYFIMPNN